MATMEYCAFENTVGNMRVSLEKMRGLDDLDSLDKHERRSFHTLLALCRKFSEEGNPLATDCASDE